LIIKELKIVSEFQRFKVSEVGRKTTNNLMTETLKH